MSVAKFITTPIVYHGVGALEKLAEESAKWKCKQPAVVTDPGVVNAGLLTRVIDSLRQDPIIFKEVEPEPSTTLADQCANFLKENKCDLVIGLGGGSAIDTAKMAASLAAAGGSVLEYWGTDKTVEDSLPVIAIPTTAGTGSEVTAVAVFKNPVNQIKRGFKSDVLLPNAAILDPILTLSLPQNMTASTGMDALTHAIEAFTTNATTLMSDMVAERAIFIIGHNIRRAFFEGDNLEAREGMLMGSYLAGIALAVAGVGAVHSFAHTLGGMYGVPHGTSNAMLLPYVMDFNRKDCVEKYARIALLLGEPVEGFTSEKASHTAVDAIRRLKNELRIPQKIRNLGIQKDCIDKVAHNCLETQVGTLSLNAKKINLVDAKRILSGAY
jgi:alcohol dehydrogenase class IV